MQQRSPVLRPRCDTAHTCAHTKPRTHTQIIMRKPKGIAGSNLQIVIPLLVIAETHLIHQRKTTLAKAYLCSLCGVLRAYLYLSFVLKGLSYILKFLPDGNEELSKRFQGMKKNL